MAAALQPRVEPRLWRDRQYGERRLRRRGAGGARRTPNSRQPGRDTSRGGKGGRSHYRASRHGEGAEAQVACGMIGPGWRGTIQGGAMKIIWGVMAITP